MVVVLHQVRCNASDSEPSGFHALTALAESRPRYHMPRPQYKLHLIRYVQTPPPPHVRRNQLPDKPNFWELRNVTLHSRVWKLSVSGSKTYADIHTPSLKPNRQSRNLDIHNSVPIPHSHDAWWFMGFWFGIKVLRVLVVCRQCAGSAVMVITA